MDISVVIVNYNTKEHLKNCLQSLFRNSYGGDFEVIVVDNASSDGSHEMVKDKFPDVKLLVNRSNEGFSVAVNQALRIYNGRYVLLLNPDTLVLPHAIDTLAEFMESHENVGAASPRLWLDADKNFQMTVTVKPPTPAFLASGIPVIKKYMLKALHFRYWQKDYEVWAAKDAMEVEALNGSCLIVRRETVEDIGALDANFFLFFEDVDWSARMRAGGWKLYCVSSAEVVHFGMKSVQKAKNIRKISEKSLNYYIKKHWSVGAKFLWSVYSLSRFVGFDKLQRLKKKLGSLLPRSSKERIPPVKQECKDISFQWESIDKASSYLLEISQDPFFLYKAGTFLEAVQYTLPSFLAESWPPGQYFWRIAPVYKDGDLGEYCLPRKFRL